MIHAIQQPNSFLCSLLFSSLWHKYDGPCVKDSDYGSHVFGCPYGRQTGNPASNDKNLCGWHAAGSRYLACEEPGEMVCCLNDRPADTCKCFGSSKTSLWPLLESCTCIPQGLQL